MWRIVRRLLRQHPRRRLGLPELTVSLTCTAKAALTPTPCNVTARFDGATLPSAKVTNVDWDWGDGVPVPPQTTVPATTHTYSVAGSYTDFRDRHRDDTQGCENGADVNDHHRPLKVVSVFKQKERVV